MTRWLANLTLDTLAELPQPCRSCMFWQLDPMAAWDTCRTGDPGLEKEAWVSQILLEWGSCGMIAYVDDLPVGYAMYAPPAYLPRAAVLPTGPASADAVLLTTVHVLAAHTRAGLGRMLVQAAARDLRRRGVRAIEAFGDAAFGEPELSGVTGGRCVTPANLYLSVGFKTVRPHHRFPRLRWDLRTALAWRSDVEYAWDTLLDSMRPYRPIAATIANSG